MINTLPDKICKAQENTRKQQRKFKERHDAHLRNDITFNIREKVLLYDMKRHAVHGDKFTPQWSEEWYYVHDDYKNGAYRLRNQRDQLLKKTINGFQLKRFHQRQDFLEPRIIIEEN